MKIKAKLKNRNQKTYSLALEASNDAWLAHLLSCRVSDIEKERIMGIMFPNFKLSMPNLSLYSDMDKAAKRIGEAIERKEKIVCAVDFDSDGINSGAIFYRAMSSVFMHPSEKFDVQISHRIHWGYGYTEYAVRNIFRNHGDSLPDLIITADQGSSNEEEVKLTYQLAKELNHNIDVIVTDHHEIPGNGPVSAFAFINPQKDSINQDLKDICGATVLWFVLVRTYQILEEKGYPLPPLAKQKLFELVSHCSIATISDVMSLATPLNRAICKAGFSFINNSQHPAWAILRANSESLIDEEFIGFNLAPKINSASRIGLSGDQALKFLCSTDMTDASYNWELISDSNEERKEIGAKMMEDAMKIAQEQVNEGRFVLVVFLPDGTPGVSGIVAGRLKEHFNRPAIMMSPSSESQATGSARSTPGLNIRDCLEEVHNKDPFLIPKFGGHPAAAGMTVPIEKIEKFHQELDSIIKSHLSESDLVPIVEVDFDLDKAKAPFSVAHVEKINQLKPFGQKFPAPLAVVSGQITDMKPMGKKRTVHLRFTLLTNQGHRYQCVWFNAIQNEDDPWPIQEQEFTSFVIQPSINQFRGQKSLQFFVVSQCSKE